MSETIEPDADDKTIKRIDEFVERIGEHCHSIRVIAVLPKPGGDSSIYTIGNGEFYSQIGAAKEWITRQDEATRIKAREDLQ